MYGAVVGHIVGSLCAVGRAMLDALAEEGQREGTPTHKKGKRVIAKRVKGKHAKKD